MKTNFIVYNNKCPLQGRQPLFFGSYELRLRDLLILKQQNVDHIISYHLFSFCRSVLDYKIHMDMEIVTFLGIKK